MFYTMDKSGLYITLNSRLVVYYHHLEKSLARFPTIFISMKIIATNHFTLHIITFSTWHRSVANACQQKQYFSFGQNIDICFDCVYLCDCSVKFLFTPNAAVLFDDVTSNPLLFYHLRMTLER